MAKPNYAFEKRQRELAKKRRKEEKALRKTHPHPPGGDGAEGAAGAEGEAGAEGVTPAVSGTAGDPAPR
jgi:hypothetical protein